MTVQVRAVQTGAVANATSWNVALPSTTAGDLVLVQVSCTITRTVNPPAGFTLVPNSFQNIQPDIRVFYRTVGATEAASYPSGYTFTSATTATTAIALAIALYSDTGQALTIEDSQGLTTTNLPNKWPAVTIVNPSLLVAMASRSANVSVDPAPGFTERIEAVLSNDRTYVQTIPAASAGTYGPYGIGNASTDNWSAVLIAVSDPAVDPEVDDTIRATTLVEYAELEGTDIEVTTLLLMAETEGEGIAVTLAGEIVEVGNDDIRVTFAGRIAELEYVPPMATYYPEEIVFPSQHKVLPEAKTGYQLDDKGSFWT